MPAIRARGSSASTSDRAVISCVPLSPSPSGTVTRRSSVFSRAVICAANVSAAAAVCAGRSARDWLALSSSSITTISVSGARSSCCTEGPDSAARTTSIAAPRSAQPCNPRSTAKATATSASAATPHKIGSGISGSKMMVDVIGPTCPAAQAHAPDRIYSCRSAHA